ncbi:MAG: hypothetical protein JSU88_11615 [Nitrospinaceae bacterium]|nr:MAG: hypothetical protein JSU88_11615 [Nitrospinaceae bacterium]
MFKDADQFFASYIQRFLEENQAARDLAERLRLCGVGLMPLVDHCTLRTHDVDLRARQVLGLGFRQDEALGVLEFENWWAKVYRRPGYPALFIDQAFAGERGRGSLIPQWVDAHGDQRFHHIAVLVEDIEAGIKTLKARGIECTGDIVGKRGSDLRQIFTRPEKKDGEPFTVLELIERHNGYSGFLPPQAEGLMKSTRE